ncbi:MAG: nucleotidyl transferase AbiEii/AbiGii toxin family protein [Candidatus Sumerlaeota bacterium]|nr:nucleotidyl transferase AbiEii/AbiGii toxin family protein [Candidatus Sumerlaeota bacterium]
MAVTEFQLAICRLIARQRLESGESYVAGGVALNALTGGARLSRDIDLFHDTAEAVAASWEIDRGLLEANGYRIRAQHERPGYVEAVVSRGAESVAMQWAADSAFRFFPLAPHDDFGLTLHPFDLATNKVLALVGRLEARDWVDVIHCHERIQRLGFLAWAASGKDPGFSPAAILEQAGRSARYSAAEIAALAFAGAPPSAADLSRQWHEMLREGRELVAALPPAEVGKCMLDERGGIFAGGVAELRAILAAGAARFHEGRIRGALPQVCGD